MSQRCRLQKVADFIFFPLRALLFSEKDRLGLSSWATERFDYVAQYARGYCLDIGCGMGNRFIKEFLKGNGKGIDVRLYDGLTSENVVTDMTHIPFLDASFDTVTFIANINHVPKDIRLLELQEARRCLRKGGRVVITMGSPILEIGAHLLLHLRDIFLGYHDVYHEHFDKEKEAYHLSDEEIKGLLASAGFTNIQKKYFVTQWFLNHLFVAEKVL